MKKIIFVFLLFSVVFSVSALTVEEIFDEETNTLKKYSFSNDQNEIQSEINTKTKGTIDLNNITWKLVDNPKTLFPHVMPQNIKSAINRLNLNYSLSIVITEYRSTITVYEITIYRRVGTQWFNFYSLY